MGPLWSWRSWTLNFWADWRDSWNVTGVVEAGSLYLPFGWVQPAFWAIFPGETRKTDSNMCRTQKKRFCFSHDVSPLFLWVCGQNYQPPDFWWPTWAASGSDLGSAEPPSSDSSGRKPQERGGAQGRAYEEAPGGAKDSPSRVLWRIFF